MVKRHYSELLHVEADNMLYGRISSILPILRQYYPLAATPLNLQLTFITASVFWVSAIKHLVDFNNFLLSLAANTPPEKIHDQYINFLRPTSAKEGGIYPGKDGIGVKLYSVNEMSMLAFYHYLFPEKLIDFPVIPSSNTPVSQFFANISGYAPGGNLVGKETGHGIWDPNSYGQYIGGTFDKKGKNKRFTDASHIAGQNIRVGWCAMVFFCHPNITELDYVPRVSSEKTITTLEESSPSVTDVVKTPASVRRSLEMSGSSLSHQPDISAAGMRTLQGADQIVVPSHDAAETAKHSEKSKKQHHSHQKKKGRCYTAPYIRCNDDLHWTPIWNLHVHSKNTDEVKSSLCNCLELQMNEKRKIPPKVEIWVDPKRFLWKPERSPLG
jgi:hypothetical protein